MSLILTEMSESVSASNNRSESLLTVMSSPFTSSPLVFDIVRLTPFLTAALKSAEKTTRETTRINADPLKILYYFFSISFMRALTCSCSGLSLREILSISKAS